MLGAATCPAQSAVKVLINTTVPADTSNRTVQVDAIGNFKVVETRDYAEKVNWILNTSKLNNDANFITSSTAASTYQPIGSYLTTETDPIWSAASSNYSTTSQANLLYASLSGSYTNPSWIVSLPYSKITGAPTIPSTTSQISEGSNLYYTDARARAALSLTTTGSGVASYDNSTGVLNTPTPVSFTRGTGTVVANAVTINATRGQITYASNILAAGTASIAFTNSSVTATSNIQLTINGLGNTMGVMPAVYIKSQTAGSCVIDVRNLNLLSLLNTTFAIDFTVQN